MRVSFVIPAHNEEHYLPLCLNSVKEELDRTPCDAEVIVVNNVSSDRTGEVARSYKWVRVVDEPKRGLPQARHAGFVASTGELIANIDADTMLPKGWLTTVLTEFEKDPTLAALSGPHVYYDLSFFEQLLVRIFYGIGYVSYLFARVFLRAGAMLQGGNFIVRRDYLERAGGFDTSIEFYGEDTDVARRMSKVGKVKWLFRLPIYASGRRLAHEGIVTTGLRYGWHYAYTLIFGKPRDAAYVPIRDTHYAKPGK